MMHHAGIVQADRIPAVHTQNSKTEACTKKRGVNLFIRKRNLPTERILEPQRLG